MVADPLTQSNLTLVILQSKFRLFMTVVLSASGRTILFLPTMRDLVKSSKIMWPIFRGLLFCKETSRTACFGSRLLFLAVNNAHFPSTPEKEAG